jgi:hypothetical protein
VTNRYQRVHHGRKGRRWYSYHIDIEPVDYSGAIKIPSQISISRDVFQIINPNGFVRLELGKGRLNHPWYRSISPENSVPAGSS